MDYFATFSIFSSEGTQPQAQATEVPTIPVDEEKATAIGFCVIS